MQFLVKSSARLPSYRFAVAAHKDIASANFLKF